MMHRLVGSMRKPPYNFNDMEARLGSVGSFDDLNAKIVDGHSLSYFLGVNDSLFSVNDLDYAISELLGCEVESFDRGGWWRIKWFVYARRSL